MCISMQISIYFPPQVGKWQAWDLWHKTHVGPQNQPSGAQGQEGPKRVKLVISSHRLPVQTSSLNLVPVQTPSAIWDTLGYLRVADVAQQQQLDAKNDVLVHLKEPFLGNQNYPR